MKAFTTHTGGGMPLRRSQVDTDQIIPASYLKRITRTGFADGLFARWRTDPDFVLNDPALADASVLVVGPDFGTGSSREHAVWALQDYGFRVVIGTRFGPIFRSNAGKAGLLLATVSDETVDALWSYLDAERGRELTVDLPSRTITAGEASFPFEIDDYTAYRLLNGLDDIAVTLQHADDIAAFEATRPTYRPTTTGGPAR